MAAAAASPVSPPPAAETWKSPIVKWWDGPWSMPLLTVCVAVLVAPTAARCFHKAMHRMGQ